MRRAAKIDANQPDIVDALRAAGCSVQSLAAIGKGCPDLLVGVAGCGNLLIEVKDGSRKPSEQTLTEDQVKWHAGWRGQVETVCDTDGALRLVATMKGAG